MGAFTEMGGGPATGIEVEDLAVTDNRVTGCEASVSLPSPPALVWGTSGTSSDNSISGLRIVDNRIDDASRSVVVGGGTVLAATLDYEHARRRRARATRSAG